MKSIRLTMIATLLATVFLIIGCGSESTPAEAFTNCIKAAQMGDMKTFSKYLLDGDEFYDEYKKSSEEEQQLAATMMQMLLGSIMEYDYEIIEENIDGDRAELKLKIDSMEVNTPQTFTMRRQNGTWKFDLTSFRD